MDIYQIHAHSDRAGNELLQSDCGSKPVTVNVFPFSISMSKNTYSAVKYPNGVKVIMLEMDALLECVSMDE